MIKNLIKKDIFMKKTITTVAICIIFSHGIFALDAQNHESTTTPQGARYEIVQSPLVVRYTFRLDRFAGNVAQLVLVDNNMTWMEMYINDFSKIEKPTEPRFQIFASGLAVRNTFLIDTKTGNTWVLTQRFDGVLVWELLQ
jgi:hypothetical protein